MILQSSRWKFGDRLFSCPKSPAASLNKPTTQTATDSLLAPCHVINEKENNCSYFDSLQKSKSEGIIVSFRKEHFMVGRLSVIVHINLTSTLAGAEMAQWFQGLHSSFSFSFSWIKIKIQRLSRGAQGRSPGKAQSLHVWTKSIQYGLQCTHSPGNSKPNQNSPTQNSPASCN